MQRRVLVTGAAGFVGRRQTELLVERGHRVVAFVHARGLPDSAAVTVARGDVRDQASIAAALDGVDAVIHLAAAKLDERHSEAVNVGGTANVIAACKARGVRRLIYVSTQADPRGTYGRTKYAGERLAADSQLDVTILRPNLIYGADLNGAFAKIVRSVRSMPIIPLTGPALGRFWPLHVDDCCLATAMCVERDETIGKTYTLAGPDAADLNELVRMVARSMGKRPRLIHLPLWFSLLAARVCLRLMPSNPPLTVSNVLGCNQQDVDHDIAPMIAELGVMPRPLERGLNEVIGSIVRAQ